MKVIKPDDMSVLFTPVLLADRFYLAIAVISSFSLGAREDQRLLSEADMWKTIAEAMGDEALDLGYPKTRGEFLVYGSCHAPTPAQAMRIGVTVGDVIKALHVTGDRHWAALGLPSDPEPFTEMKIAYQNAYGGEGYEKNPQGKGYGQPPRQLPNVQTVGALIVSPQDQPDPAGLTAYALDMPQRRKHLGAYDEKWLAERWPFYPLDTNPEFFNVAPVDQWLGDGQYFRGDEVIRILHMHPRRVEIVSSLPRLRARVFVNRRRDGNESFEEVANRAETLWLFPDRDCGVLLFRGLAPVEDENYEELLHFMAAWEPFSQTPGTLADYHQVFLTHVNPPVEPEVEAEAPVVPPAETPVAPPAAIPLPKEAAEAEKLIAELEAETDKRLAAAGLSRKEVQSKYFAPAVAEEKVTAEEVQKAIAALEKETADHLKKAGLTKEDVVKKYLTPPAAEEKATLSDIVRHIGEVEARTASDLQKANLSRAEVVGKYLPDMADAAAMVPLMDLKKIAQEYDASSMKGAPPEEPAPPEAPTDASPPLTAEEVIRRYQSGEALTNLDLSGLDLSGRDLRGADFTGSIMEKTLLRESDLTKAVFCESILTEADFSRAHLTEANLAKANAWGARFAGAAMKGCLLAEGHFTGADFTETAMPGANLERGVFEQATFTGVKALRIKAAGTDFCFSDLTDGDFRQADLADADLSGTILDGTDLSSVQAGRIRLYGAQAHQASFAGAGMREARADGTTTMRDCRFTDADLSGSCWEGVVLSGGSMEGALLNRVNFSHADLSGVRMVNIMAKEASFMQSKFRNVDLRGTNLFKGSLRRSTLTETDMKYTNLYGVDLYKAKIQQCDLEHANLKGTLLTLKISW